jgi:predicted MFS family arabinose efflux permease
VAKRLVDFRLTAALASLGLATFAFVTTENLPVGLLPQLAHDLHRSRSATGYLVTGYAAVVVVASVPLALVTRGISRRRLLISALVVFVVAAALGAAAQSYDQLLATRVAIALAQGVFWAVVAAAGSALVPRELRGRALGIVFSGVSLSAVVGVPGLTWIGQQTNWRLSTIVASGVGLVALAAVVALLPETPAEHEQQAAPHPDARRYALVLVSLALCTTGAFAFFTYVTVFLLALGGFSTRAISPILLISGVVGAAGVYAAAAFVGPRTRATMAAGVAGIAGALLLLAAFAHHGRLDVALICLFGFSLSVFSVGSQARTLDSAPGSVNVGAAGNSAVFNVGIGGGSLLGGLLLQGAGVHAIPVVGGIVACGSLAVLVAERAFLRD